MGLEDHEREKIATTGRTTRTLCVRVRGGVRKHKEKGRRTLEKGESTGVLSEGVERIQKRVYTGRFKFLREKSSQIRR